MDANLGPYQEDQIYQGNAFILGTDVPAACADLIMCDPVWNDWNQYTWTVHFASSVLKPGGNLLMQTAPPNLWELVALVRAAADGCGNMIPVTIISETFPYAMNTHFGTRTRQGWKPWMWLRKESEPGMPKIPWKHFVSDRFTSRGTDLTLHKWGDKPEFAVYYMLHLTEPGALVIDPFTGSGTVPVVAKSLRRRFLAFEIDPLTFADTSVRLEGTTPGLDLDALHSLEQLGLLDE